MNERFDEPSLPALPQRVRRPLMALWVSLAVHGALIGLIQVAPSGAPAGGSIVLQARLDPAVSPAETPPDPEPDPSLQPSPTLKPTEILGAAPPVPPVAPAPELPAATAVPPPAAPPVEPPRPALAIDSGVDLTYYTARELDQPPTARGTIDPAYPPEADRARVSGRVRLQVKVEADGRVSDVDVVESTPAGVFDASAIEAFRAARFNPAQKGGRPVRALMLIEVSYDWEGRP
ncbi:MAG: energy transducer TonB [Thiobacillus sp.]|nr:energy transducer TonB [Thiobacillus sp.]